MLNLTKHRAEVENMFLTKFDKKMYEEAVRMDARADGLEEGRREGLEIGRKEEAKSNAYNLLKNGVSYDVVRASITLLTEDELEELSLKVKTGK